MNLHHLISYLILIGCFVTVQMYSDNDEWLAARWAKLRKRQMCDNVGEKCFSTGQCCRGLVCAAFDDYFGQKPEVPGLCVKEKDLQVCTTSKECFGGSKCAPLGRTGERYCLPRSGDGFLDEKVSVRRGDGGLGSECRSDADCMESSPMDGSPLCCQDVSRIRQGVKRMCDRKTPISRCISA